MFNEIIIEDEDLLLVWVIYFFFVRCMISVLREKFKKFFNIYFWESVMFDES